MYTSDSICKVGFNSLTSESLRLKHIIKHKPCHFSCLIYIYTYWLEREYQHFYSIHRDTLYLHLTMEAHKLCKCIYQCTHKKIIFLYSTKLSLLLYHFTVQFFGLEAGANTRLQCPLPPDPALLSIQGPQSSICPPPIEGAPHHIQISLRK